MAAAFAAGLASRNVRLFFGWREAWSNPLWVMLMSPSSGVLGLWMPRTMSLGLAPEGIVTAIELPTARWWALAYFLLTIAPSEPSCRSVCPEPVTQRNL